MKKEDLRIKKTKVRLYNGLVHLMEKESFEDIKITDICKAAMINRSTFYDHFDDKFALLIALMQDSKEELKNTFEKSNTMKKAKTINQFFLELISELILFLSKKEKNYSVLTIIQNNNHSVFYDMMYETILDTIIIEIEKNYTIKKEIAKESIAIFYTSAITKVISELLLKKEIEAEIVKKQLTILLPNIDYLQHK